MEKIIPFRFGDYRGQVSESRDYDYCPCNGYHYYRKKPKQCYHIELFRWINGFKFDKEFLKRKLNRLLT